MHVLARPALVLALLLPAAGSAGPFPTQGGWSSATGGHGLTSAWRPGAGARARRTEQLGHFTARKSFEAGVRLLELSRRAERGAAEERLRREGSLEDLARYRVRVRAEDDVDALAVRSELRLRSLRAGHLDAARWWRSLGPATRRVLVQSGLELRWLEREQDREARLRAVEHEVEGRERQPAPFSPIRSTR